MAASIIGCRKIRQADVRRRISGILTVAVTGTALLVVGAPGTAVADVPIGPGPTNYSEQPQPPPGTCHWRSAASGETLPDPNCTPGAINPKVTDATLATTICKTGYTKSIRPPASITEAEKYANAASYGYTGSMSDVEYDQMCRSSLGAIPMMPAICGWSLVSRQTAKTVSNTSCTSAYAPARRRSAQPSRQSRMIGPPH